MQSIGIYSIINRKNNKRYIGQSVHLGTRMRQHFLELKAKKHPNKTLQKAYNRDSEYFNFEVLELTTLDKLNEREAYWMNYYQTLNSNFGYNHQVVHPNRTYVKKKNLKKYINRK